MAIDFLPYNIRCNAVNPGTTQSPSLEARIAELGKKVGGVDTARQMFIDRQPMGRLAAASEIAQMCVYLASDAADFVTGQCMVIDGGVSL